MAHLQLWNRLVLVYESNKTRLPYFVHLFESLATFSASDPITFLRVGTLDTLSYHQLAKLSLKG
jgi:hypothetical protein